MSQNRGRICRIKKWSIVPAQHHTLSKIMLNSLLSLVALRDSARSHGSIMGKGTATKAKSLFEEGWKFPPPPKKKNPPAEKMQRLFATKIQWLEAVEIDPSFLEETIITTSRFSLSFRE